MHFFGILNNYFASSIKLYQSQRLIRPPQVQLIDNITRAAKIRCKFNRCKFTDRSGENENKLLRTVSPGSHRARFLWQDFSFIGERGKENGKGYPLSSINPNLGARILCCVNRDLVLVLLRSVVEQNHNVRKLVLTTLS